MTNKESNFVSAVVYLHNEQQRVGAFLARLGEFLSGRFSRYEIICVDDGCTDGTVDRVRGFGAGQAAAVTVIHRSLRQGAELCMNAGLDMAIGDFVYEFDSASLAWPEHLLGEAYDMALGQNRDIVAAAPAGSARLTSRLFYGVFNRCAPAGVHPLRSEAFRLLSRRAINRVHAVSSHLPYRKAAYAFSGLGYGVLEYPGKAADSLQGRRFGQAVDSLVLYTDAGYRVSLSIAVAMLLLTLAELVYTLVVYLGGRPVDGWTTTMLVLTGGFFGLFCILAIVIKYLSLLTELVFKQQKYLVEGVEKLPTCADRAD